MFINDLYDRINYSRNLLFTDYINIYRAINSPEGRLESDIDSIRCWCAANCMKFNICKTKVLSLLRKNNILISSIKCPSSMTRTDITKGVEIKLDSKLHSSKHLNNIFFCCIKLLGLVGSLTFTFASLECIFVSWI